MALVGGLTGYGGSLSISDILNKDARVSSFYVGSRADFEEMNQFVEDHQIRPLIDRVFGFEEAAQAFDFIENGDFMGKVVIQM
jgi:D-arabinose 1-dehydrogenase-like Zn-dependent alcohol dehydrogenase